MVKWTRRMRISIYQPAKLARNWSHMVACVLHFGYSTVEWFGAWSCLFWWRHRFQIASFSPSTLENSVFKKHRFQIAPLWRAFSNGSVFGDHFRRCSVELFFCLKTDQCGQGLVRIPKNLHYNLPIHVFSACCTLHENMHRICRSGFIVNERWRGWIIYFSQSLRVEVNRHRSLSKHICVFSEFFFCANFWRITTSGDSGAEGTQPARVVKKVSARKL